MQVTRYSLFRADRHTRRRVRRWLWLDLVALLALVVAAWAQGSLTF